MEWQFVRARMLLCSFAREGLRTTYLLHVKELVGPITSFYSSALAASLGWPGDFDSPSLPPTYSFVVVVVVVVIK